MKRANALILLFIMLKSTVGFCVIGMSCCDDKMEISCDISEDNRSTSEFPDDNSMENTCTNSCCTINASVFMLDYPTLFAESVELTFVNNPDYTTGWLKLETSLKIFQPPRVV